MSISTQPYKGTRDFYPKNSIISQGSNTDYMIYQRYIIDTWRRTMIGLGFSEYEASIIESAQIYLEKSGEELGSKQLYSFLDKGDRKIALRPEMTPTLARIIANNRQNLRYPLRWFSIPNCFRYEAPQKGRNREFWQLNVDIIGIEGEGVDQEMLFVANQVMKAFGGGGSYTIRVGDRQILDGFITSNALESKKPAVYKLLDEWKKLKTIENRTKFALELNLTNIEFVLCNNYVNNSKLQSDTNSENIQADNSIVRGLAYYTGVVFEAFDNNPNNSRSLMGGGRYDKLFEIFDGQDLPCIGFGAGDIVLMEYLKHYQLLDGHPSFETWKKANYPEVIGLMILDEDNLSILYNEILPHLSEQGKTWDIDYDYTRAENKRYETLKKRGCTEIIKV